MANFEIYQFMIPPGPFEYFKKTPSENPRQLDDGV